MISPGEIAFDIDGVFANTMGLFIDIVRKEYGLNHIEYGHITQYYLEECLDISPDIISQVIQGILSGDHDERLKPLHGSCSVLTALGKEAPLLFVTARPHPGIEKWVRRMLPDVAFPVEVVATGAHEAKIEILMERGIRYFVEDYLETCRLLDRHGIVPLLFHQPWNRTPHPFQEVRDWEEIRAFLDLSAS